MKFNASITCTLGQRLEVCATPANKLCVLIQIPHNPKPSCFTRAQGMLIFDHVYVQREC